MMTKQELKKLESHGFKWAYDEKGAHFFQKKLDKGYALIRCLPEDMLNGNFEFQTLHGLTNTNKA